MPGRTAAVRKVLLATDLAPTSDLATDWAFEQARQNNAALLVVSVIDPRELALTAGRAGTRVDQVRLNREDAAVRLVERGRKVGVRVSFLVWTGEPGESIVAAAEAEGADLIVVGSHGRGTLGRLVLGSVSEHVVRHATCPVLVVRALDERAAELYARVVVANAGDDRPPGDRVAAGSARGAVTTQQSKAIGS